MPPHSKILYLSQPIGWLHSPGLSGFPTSKQRVSVEEKHHTRTTIAALKHEKSHFIFDRLPTFNGRVFVLHKQTVRLGMHRPPTAVALVVSWITGNDGAVVKMAHTELHSDSATVNRALSHFRTALRWLQHFQMSELRLWLEPVYTVGSVRCKIFPASAVKELYWVLC